MCEQGAEYKERLPPGGVSKQSPGQRLRMFCHNQDTALFGRWLFREHARLDRKKDRWLELACWIWKGPQGEIGGRVKRKGGNPAPLCFHAGENIRQHSPAARGPCQAPNASKHRFGSGCRPGPGDPRPVLSVFQFPAMILIVRNGAHRVLPMMPNAVFPIEARRFPFAGAEF